MRHALWTLVVVTLMSAASQAIAQNWKEHRPEGANYVVEMPGEPKINSQNVSTKVGDIKVYIAASELGELGFVTMFSRYPESYVQSQAADAMLDGAAANVKGKLRSKTSVTISNFPGREILADTPTGRVMVLRYFLSGNTLVQAIAGGPAGSETNADVRRFLDSLRSTAAK